ncbi:putative glycosyl transferase [Golovinomyces cichoracearum]|uniref:Putative glycosyl transferase n=1 Tax=Golovinomyces cichoracearum TaxID=62708 RepID=A0A420HAN0_9PEZI|nr:putative glycosyl transferase [Golovinomyces cichoracearum]
MCTTFGVQQNQFDSAFPAMLTGPAHEYYYDHIAGQGLNFVEICNRMRQHFEIEERRYEMMNEWHNLSLITIIKNHPENSIINSFEILVSEMQRIRRGLDAEHQTDKAMKTRLQIACRDVEACSSASMKLTTSFEGLCSDIRLAILLE